MPTFVHLLKGVFSCACSRLDFTVYAVNRLPFVKASCRSLEAPLSASEGVVHHPFVAFFTSFARAKAAACWLSECGEEVYVHRFRANKSVEGRWHPIRCVHCCHLAICGVFVKDSVISRHLPGAGIPGGREAVFLPDLPLSVQARAEHQPPNADVPLCSDRDCLQRLASAEGA